MIQYPNIDPIIFHVGFLSVRWYGLMYFFGFIIALLLACQRAKRPNSGWTSDQLADLLFYVALGVVIGGRVGYMLFYDFSEIFTEPLKIFKIWQGGMSFHGGLLGVLISLILFAKKYHRHFADIADYITPLVPIGLGLGRIGNFINGELYGKVTQVPWAMVFPQGGPVLRHPSQLYEFLLEGVFLFTVLWTYSSQPKPRYAVSGLFLVLYGVCRILVEFFREPDIEYGYLAYDWLTMGQVLSVPMVLLGLFLMHYAYRHPVYAMTKIGEAS